VQIARKRSSWYSAARLAGHRCAHEQRKRFCGEPRQNQTRQNTPQEPASRRASRPTASTPIISAEHLRPHAASSMPPEPVPQTFSIKLHQRPAMLSTHCAPQPPRAPPASSDGIPPNRAEDYRSVRVFIEAARRYTPASFPLSPVAQIADIATTGTAPAAMASAIAIESPSDLDVSTNILDSRRYRSTSRRVFELPHSQRFSALPPVLQRFEQRSVTPISARNPGRRSRSRISISSRCSGCLRHSRLTVTTSYGRYSAIGRKTSRVNAAGHHFDSSPQTALLHELSGARPLTTIRSNRARARTPAFDRSRGRHQVLQNPVFRCPPRRRSIPPAHPSPDKRPWLR